MLHTYHLSRIENDETSDNDDEIDDNFPVGKLLCKLAPETYHGSQTFQNIWYPSPSKEQQGKKNKDAL
ncbi:hypothetical protein Tco_0976821 [Tanacetum coccineum]|uniref:Uncharacterized protein n=1 Tax=Tanacetum coccineum TaxID=301880 RepID=A0ABQ5EIB4_9ASTR